MPAGHRVATGLGESLDRTRGRCSGRCEGLLGMLGLEGAHWRKLGLREAGVPPRLQPCTFGTVGTRHGPPDAIPPKGPCRSGAQSPTRPSGSVKMVSRCSASRANPTRVVPAWGGHFDGRVGDGRTADDQTPAGLGRLAHQARRDPARQEQDPFGRPQPLDQTLPDQPVQAVVPSDVLGPSHEIPGHRVKEGRPMESSPWCPRAPARR